MIGDDSKRVGLGNGADGGCAVAPIDGGRIAAAGQGGIGVGEDGAECCGNILRAGEVDGLDDRGIADRLYRSAGRLHGDAGGKNLARTYDWWAIGCGRAFVQEKKILIHMDIVCSCEGVGVGANDIVTTLLILDQGSLR